MARNFLASKIIGSDQLTAVSRMPNHGFFHESTCGQVTTSAGLTLNVGAIPAGAAVVNGTTLGAVAGTTVTLAAADATNPRRDIVWVDTSGAWGKTTGTAAAAPAAPALTVGRLAAAEIAVAANAASITSGNIADMRQTLPFGTPRWVTKSLSEAVNNSSGMQNDDALFFSIFPSESWKFELMAKIEDAPATPGIQFQWSLPAGGSGLMSGAIYSPTALVTVVPPVTVTTAESSSGTILTNGYIYIRGTISASATAGTANWQWAQLVATAVNTTIAGSSGSYLIAQRIA